MKLVKFICSNLMFYDLFPCSFCHVNCEVMLHYEICFFLSIVLYLNLGSDVNLYNEVW